MHLPFTRCGDRSPPSGSREHEAHIASPQIPPISAPFSRKGNLHLKRFLSLLLILCFAREPVFSCFIHVDNYKALDLIKRISTRTSAEPFHYAALHRLHFETW